MIIQDLSFYKEKESRINEAEKGLRIIEKESSYKRIKQNQWRLSLAK